MKRELILTLADQRATLEMVGGKGASLTCLFNAGLPVPDGFHVTTAAYQEFVRINDLQPLILETIQAVGAQQPAALEAASQRIREAFLGGHMPEDTILAITQAYRQLPGDLPPVAVRSSATAEDLPEASFAGQQETYLNIHGVEALLEAVKQCWASLWTARAIAYRMKNQVDQNAVALAVVVQSMVNADAAGILFTANPVSGRRDEMVINAAWGLGEAVVGGLVSPDTITADKATGSVKSMQVAEKTVITVLEELGTREQALEDERRSLPVLTEPQVAELVDLARRVEALYGSPQDIEWCHAGERFYIVQARPITTLPGTPVAWQGPHPKAMFMRGSLAEHLPIPVTPLFATLGLDAANLATRELTQSLGFDAVEAEYQYRVINGYVYFGFLAAPRIFLKMTKGGLVTFMTMFRGTKERWLEARERLDAVIKQWEDRTAAGDAVRALPGLELLEGAREVFTQLGRFYTVLQATTLPAATLSEMILGRVYRMARRKGDPEMTALVHGLDTMPLKAEKALFDLAMWVKDQAGAAGQNSLADAILCLPSEELAAALREERVPAGVSSEAWSEWKARFVEYLQVYGATVYSLDFANPTPQEAPEPALDALKMYLNGQGQNPYERQRAAEELRQRTMQSVLVRAKWPVKGWFVKALNWALECGPAREDSLYDLGKAHPLVRRLIGEIGRRLSGAGALDSADDIYWLYENEVIALLSQLERGERLTDMRDPVRERRAAWHVQLKLTPPAIIPEKSSWGKMMPWHKTDDGGNTLKGIGASAGRVTAPACVLLSPEDFGKMKPGKVLVAVTTTPAWTPLFAMASAVVTDIGGPLSHGSIVAREYGIPAVMSAGMATRRIHDGQMVTVDGSAGLVILDNNGSENGKQAG